MVSNSHEQFVPNEEKPIHKQFPQQAVTYPSKSIPGCSEMNSVNRSNKMELQEPDRDLAPDHKTEQSETGNDELVLTSIALMSDIPEA
jgi:hypothetical protein